MNTTMLCNLQKQDKFGKNKVGKLHANIDDRFYLNTDSILKQNIIINNLEVNTTVIPSALTHTLLHEFHNCRGHQGCTKTFNLLKEVLVEGMRRDVKYHINCITCSKNSPNALYHPQLNWEFHKEYALTCIDLITSYVIAVPMPDKTAESIVEAYLSGILSRTGTSMVCLSDSGSELKNIQMNTVLKQLGIKHIFPIHIDPKVILVLKMCIIS